jgi:hypothetical protein
MPDFYAKGTYLQLAADPASLAQIDFFNIQFYNQNQFHSIASLFTVDDLNPGWPGDSNSMAGIVKNIVEFSNTTFGGSTAVTEPQVNEKMNMGFPCKDGSLPVGATDLNQCGKAQFDAVQQGVHVLKYPLAGVFEWSAGFLKPDDLHAWNSGMASAMTV